MPSNDESSAHRDYVPALCTHRPSLVPTSWLSESHGVERAEGQPELYSAKSGELNQPEELKVVTRSP